MKARLLFSVVVLCAACAPRQPVTLWGYSSWYERGGGGSMGIFEEHQKRCLAQSGIADAASVAPDSPEENAFVECMNASGWCTNSFGCDKPGA